MTEHDSEQPQPARVDPYQNPGDFPPGSTGYLFANFRDENGQRPTRLRFSIDLLDDDFNHAIGLQLVIRKAVLDYLGPGVPVEEVSSHLHVGGCNFCEQSRQDPKFHTHPLTLDPPSE